MINADGWRTKTNESFIQLNKTTIDSFQYLCVLIGKASKHYIRTVAEYKGNHYGKNDMNIVSVKSNKRISNFSYKKITYKGIVWCPELKNGTVVCRRSGHTYLSGNTWANYKLTDTPWYIIGQGAWGMGCKKAEFERYRGYERYHKTYGGEFYITSKWWMVGSTVMVDPKAIGYHLGAGRGYSYHHLDYVENVLNLLYALGADDWRERTYINYLRSKNKADLDRIMIDGAKAYEGDRKWMAKHRKYTFNDLLVKRPWEQRNIKLYGKSNCGISIFHWSELDLISQNPIAMEGYRNSKLQKQLHTFITENLSQYIYRPELYPDKERFKEMVE